MLGGLKPSGKNQLYLPVTHILESGEAEALQKQDFRILNIY